jgi:mannosylglycoprotein endo-beta-mannosidase
MFIQNELWKREQIEEIAPLTWEQLNNRPEWVCELMKILEEEEQYWFRRSHETWLHKGDTNTEFFHRIANGRKRNNTILFLENEDGIIKGGEDLLKYATEYYKNLFGPENSKSIPLDPDCWGEEEKLTSVESEKLCRPFTEEEIKYALFQMEHNKAAGPNSMPIEFFQTCWDIIKSDIVEMFNDFHKQA